MARGSGGIGRALDGVFGAGSRPRMRPSVLHTPELERVRALPWRVEDPELVDVLTEALRAPNGSMRLFPIQAQALADLHDHGGLLGSIGVGHGKTLITFLAPVVMEAQHPVLLVPAKLVRKTERDFAELAKHWTPPGAGISPHPSAIRIVSYEKLGRQGGEQLLDGCDLLMADECHRLKNRSAACTRRFLRWCEQHPNVPVLAMSGTVTSRSLRDFHHLLACTHGHARMPLPIGRHELNTWAAATDEKVVERAEPGALKVFVEGEDLSIENVRKGLGDRIFGTPGCVRTVDDTVPASIYVTSDDPELPPEVCPYFAAMDEDQAPNGDLLLPQDRYRFTRTLALGFYHEWDPPPPWEWLEARRHWHRVVREALEREIPGVDSPMDVARMVEGGHLSGAAQLERWRAVRETYEPNSVPRWLSFAPLEQIARKIREPALVWVEHVDVGRKLSEITGWKYYQRKGLASDGQFIDDAPCDRPAILSIASNLEGRNLQHWRRNYIVTPPPKGEQLEQLLGRTHRIGQEADTVEVVVRFGHPDIRATFLQTIRDAKRDQAMTGQPKKILLADLDL